MPHEYASFALPAEDRKSYPTRWLNQAMEWCGQCGEVLDA